MQVKTQVKAGGDQLNHNQTLVTRSRAASAPQGEDPGEGGWDPLQITTRPWYVTRPSGGKSSQVWRGACTPVSTGDPRRRVRTACKAEGKGTRATRRAASMAARRVWSGGAQRGAAACASVRADRR